MEQFSVYTILFDNSIVEYLSASIVFIAIYLAGRITQTFLRNHVQKLVKKTDSPLDNSIIQAIQKIGKPFFICLAAFFALQTLSIHIYIHYVSIGLLIVGCTYYLTQIFDVIANYIVEERLHKKDDGSTTAAVQMLTVISKLVTWVLAGLVFLTNIGVNVNSVIAGLGIGGIAVALASQNILADLFSSFAILFDQPFTVGDYVAVGTEKGTVTKIGIKTTRIRSPHGEEIVLPNSELGKANILNYKRMEKRMVKFQLGFEYGTPTKKLRMIPELVEKIISGQNDDVEFTRCHFIELGESALLFDVVYHITDRNYRLHTDTLHAINLELLEVFEQEGIALAFPSQTVYVRK